MNYLQSVSIGQKEIWMQVMQKYVWAPDSTGHHLDKPLFEIYDR